jgi:hypothetical protein
LYNVTKADGYVCFCEKNTNKIFYPEEELIMLDCLKAINWKKTGLFAAGVAFGTAGIKILSSDDAKNVYSNCTAAVLRAKDCVMNVVSTVQENAEDIYAEAVEINEERAAKKECFEDEADDDDFEEVENEADAEAAADAE